MTRFYELAKLRYSSRKYLPTPIEKEKIELLLETARIAPSAANKQPYKFYFIQTNEKLKEIYTVYHREWFKDSPLVIVGCINRSEAWVRQSDNKNHADIDIAIAIDHITLQAAELGLATCWICNFDVEKCKRVLNLPTELEPAVILPVAYPADKELIYTHLDKRKKTNDLVIWF